MRDTYDIGVLIPTSGVTGIWGPSSLASATLACELWNDAGGYRGREVRLVFADAAHESPSVEEDVRHLIDVARIDALVGMHTSAVRERVCAALDGTLPFVYTPLYEGGALPRAVYAIGETPEQQLLPALGHLTRQYRLRRWYLIGNDYCWPRRSHRLAQAEIASAGAAVVRDRYVDGLDEDRLDAIIDDIAASGADALLISLVGQDAVEFNRAFAAAGLSDRVLRLSCAIEENSLLAIGPDATDGMFVAASYFASLSSDANLAFKERYLNRFGARAPVLNALGQSTYEGIAFLRGLLENRPARGQSVPFDSVRHTRWHSNARKSTPVYLAQADGMSLRVTRTLS